MHAFLLPGTTIGSGLLRKARHIPLRNATQPLHPWGYQSPIRSSKLARPHASLATTPVSAGSKVDELVKNGLGVVVVKRGKTRLFREGDNTMVFAGAVEKCIAVPGKDLEACDAVAVCDGQFSCIGFGFFNPHSMFRVRMLRHARGEVTGWDYRAEIVERVREAVLCRQSIGLPREDTNVYRVVNGDGDRLSGLVVDRVGDFLVVSSSALWCERYEGEIRDALKNVFGDGMNLIWRRNIERLRQDGWEGTVEDVEVMDGLEDAIVVKEEGVKYAVSRYALTKGQKTGHYADQRENRAYIGQLISKLECPKVLDLFCYTGGFGINAALYNAESRIIGVDSSAKAIVMGSENARLNGVEERVELLHADVMKYMQGEGKEKQGSFDMVILDPPKFAPNVKSLPRAIHKYKSLNSAAIRMVKASGLLCSCTCSAAMTADRKLFVETVRKAGAEAGREISLVKTIGAAADHVVAAGMMETEYLTMCVFVCR